MHKRQSTCDVDVPSARGDGVLTWRGCLLASLGEVPSCERRLQRPVWGRCVGLDVQERM